MASVARLMTLFHKLEIFPRVFWPKLYRHQLLLHYPLSQQKFICSFCANIPSRQYSTFKILFKKHDTAKDEKVPKKKAAVSKDEKTVHVFDESGLFVGKQKLWKAKADAAKKNLRLLEMNGSTKSKKKDKADSDDDTEESDIMSYKLVSVEEFMEKINEVKAQKAKAEKLRHIVIKSNIDKGGLDIKISQIKDILKKKGKVKIAIQTNSVNGGQVSMNVFRVRPVAPLVGNISTICTNVINIFNLCRNFVTNGTIGNGVAPLITTSEPPRGKTNNVVSEQV